MKQTSKNYLFYNFNVKIKPNIFEKSDLSINYCYNIDTSTQKIFPTLLFENYFKNKYSDSEYQNLLSGTNFKQITKLFPYDYYDQTSQKIFNRLFALTSNFDFVELNQNTMEFVNLELNFRTTPLCFFHNEQMILSSPGNLTIVIDKNNDPYTITSFPNITHYVKIDNTSYVLFDEKKYSIFKVNDLDIFDLPTASYDYVEIQVNPEYGQIIDLFEYNNYLLIIQEYKISKITSTTLNEKLSSTIYCNSRIYPNSAVKMNDYVIFLTSSGLFLFDGNDSKSICSNISQYITCDSFTAVAYDDHYYLLTDFYINELKERIILDIDIANELCTLHKLTNSAENIYVIKNSSEYKLCVLTKNSDTFELLVLNRNKTTNEHKEICFNKLTFDTSAIKNLKAIRIYGGGKYIISISNETSELTFNSENNLILNNVGLKGQFFEFSIKSDYPFFINAINFEVDVIEDYL